MQNLQRDISTRKAVPRGLHDKMCNRVSGNKTQEEGSKGMAGTKKEFETNISLVSKNTEGI